MNQDINCNSNDRIYDRYVNQGMRILRPLKPFYLKQFSLFDLLNQGVLKLYYILKGYINHFTIFDITFYRLVEIMMSLFIVNPLQATAIVIFRLIKPSYYYLSFDDDADHKYVSLNQVI